jgi:hypothetical protein
VESKGRERKKKGKERGRKEVIGATSRGIDLHVPQFNSNFHMIQAEIRSKIVIEQGKGKERDSYSTEVEHYSNLIYYYFNIKKLEKFIFSR